MGPASMRAANLTRHSANIGGARSGTYSRLIRLIASMPAGS
jgi:hypothetical protein